MPEFDADDDKEFQSRMANGIVQELFIKEVRLRTASTFTCDGVDNYPVMVIVPQRPPGYVDDDDPMEEFFIIPLADRTLSREAGQPVLDPLRANSILVAAGNLLQLIYDDPDSAE